MEAKKRLARVIVTEYQGASAATRAEEYFESKHQRREIPANALFIPKPYVGRAVIDAMRTFVNM